MPAFSHRILGIDPGLETTGFGVIEYVGTAVTAKDYGVFLTKRSFSAPERLHQIALDVEEILDLWKPSLLAIERLVFVKNVTSGLAVAEARGVILERAAARSIPVVELLPMEVKKKVTGHGKAPKPQVAKMVQIILKLSQLPQPDDAADALAIALAAWKNDLF